MREHGDYNFWSAHREGVRRGHGRGAGERGNRGGFPVHCTKAELTVAKAMEEARRRLWNDCANGGGGVVS
jgi:ribosomal protein L15